MPTLKSVERDSETGKIRTIEAEINHLHLKLYFPQVKEFEYFNKDTNTLEKLVIVDSDYQKLVKKEFRSLQKV